MSIASKATKIGVLGSGLGKLYHEIKQDDLSFKNRWEHSIREDTIGERTLEQIAVQYGLKDEFEEYIVKDLHSVRGYTASAYYGLAIIKDTIEDSVAAGISLTEIVAAIPTGGAAVVALEAAEIPLEAVIQITYDALGTGLGLLSGTYTLGKEGAKRYIHDMGLSNIDAVIKTTPLIDKIVELGTDLGDPSESIFYASRQRAKYWLTQRVREIDQHALPQMQREQDMIDRIQRIHPRFSDFGKVSVSKSRVPYEDLVSGPYVSSAIDVVPAQSLPLSYETI